MAAAEKISITLTPEMLRLVEAAVEAGEFASLSEALRDAVRVWTREREERAERLEAIRARIRQSMEDPRPPISGDELDRRMDALFQRLRRDNEAA